MDGDTYRDRFGTAPRHLPIPGVRACCRRHRTRSCRASSRTSAAGGVNVMIKGQAELAQGEYVSGDFFRGLAVRAGGRAADPGRRRSRRRRAGRGRQLRLQPAALRRCRERDRTVDSHQQRAVHRDRRHAAGVLRRRSGRRAGRLSPDARQPALGRRVRERRFLDPNYYWVEMMGRLRPGVDLAQAQAALAGPFAQWVAATATQRCRARESSGAAPRGRARADSTASAASTRSRSTCCWRWWA